MKECFRTLICAQECSIIELNSNIKVKFLILIHQVLSTMESISRETLKTFKGIEDDTEKGQHKVKL